MCHLWGDLQPCRGSQSLLPSGVCLKPLCSHSRRPGTGLSCVELPGHLQVLPGCALCTSSCRAAPCPWPPPNSASVGGSDTRPWGPHLGRCVCALLPDPAADGHWEGPKCPLDLFTERHPLLLRVHQSRLQNLPSHGCCLGPGRGREPPAFPPGDPAPPAVCRQYSPKRSLAGFTPC